MTPPATPPGHFCLPGVPLRFPVFPAGVVWLVGAGPGDPGLLTLHAVAALAQAERILADSLTDPGLRQALGHLAPRAVVEDVGKRGGRPSPSQAEITARLIACARSGEKVLRLKGGDPVLFGRGPEEALALAAAGIPFRFIPGITAGIGGLAYAGVPVTAGESNSAVTFITGHGPEGGLPQDVDWEALARSGAVLVFYMALRPLAAIATALRAAGRPPGEAVLLVSQAASAQQKVVETTLERCAAGGAPPGVNAPALVVLGPTLALRQRLLQAAGDPAAWLAHALSETGASLSGAPSSGAPSSDPPPSETSLSDVFPGDAPRGEESVP